MALETYNSYILLVSPVLNKNYDKIAITFDNWISKRTTEKSYIEYEMSLVKSVLELFFWNTHDINVSEVELDAIVNWFRTKNYNITLEKIT